MHHRRSLGERTFDWANVLLLTIVSCLALYPFLYVVGLSFGSGPEVASGQMFLFPKQPTLQAYKIVLVDDKIATGFVNSVFRTLLGTACTLFATAMAAYPLSRRRMPFRKSILFFIIFTMLFSGGLVPRYLWFRELGLLDTRLVLVLPIMLTGFNIIILRNFFQQIPESLEEAARIDGASDLAILFRIFIPLSKPALATIALWTCVVHWNQWLDALLFIADDDKQVLQVFLQRLVVDSSLTRVRYGSEAFDANMYSPEAVKAATIVIATLPIIALYPFLQRFFIRGLVMGGVKE